MNISQLSFENLKELTTKIDNLFKNINNLNDTCSKTYLITLVESGFVFLIDSSGRVVEGYTSTQAFHSKIGKKLLLTMINNGAIIIV